MARLQNVASFLSLVLCTATVALWVRSNHTIDCLERASPSHRRNVCAASGREHVIVNWMWTAHPDSQPGSTELKWTRIPDETPQSDAAYPGPG